MKKFNFQRRTEINTTEATEALKKNNIIINPSIMKLGGNWELGFEDWVYLSISDEQDTDKDFAIEAVKEKGKKMLLKYYEFDETNLNEEYKILRDLQYYSVKLGFQHADIEFVVKELMTTWLYETNHSFYEDIQDQFADNYEEDGYGEDDFEDWVTDEHGYNWWKEAFDKVETNEEKLEFLSRYRATLFCTFNRDSWDTEIIWNAIEKNDKNINETK